jgi:hypothetical protein
MFRISAACGVLALAACGPRSLQCGPGTHEEAGVCTITVTDAGTDAGSGGGDGGVDGGLDGGLNPLEEEPDCARVLAGPSSQADRVLAFSAAHASVRLFGPQANYTKADNALADALEVDRFDDAALVAYATALPGVCVLRADDGALPAASVEQVGNVAIIHPGTGAVAVPEAAAGVAIDLRGLPQSPGLSSALEAAVAEALTSPLARPDRVVRQHQGYTDQSKNDMSYLNALQPLQRPPYPGHAAIARPVAVITAGALAPQAAELAGALRLSGKAWLWGSGVSAAAAESELVGVGQLAIAYRGANLSTAGSRWPDEVPADVDEAGLASVLPTLPSLGQAPRVSQPAPARAALAPLVMSTSGLKTELSIGTARAALLTIHGVLKRFFPYFAVVGDGLDDRLNEVLGTLEQLTLTRDAMVDLAGRLGEVIHDGHNFIGDFSGQNQPAGYFAVRVDQVAGEPVIAQSLAAGVNPGDAIVAIAGTPTAQWYATEYPRTAGATPGYKFDLATRKYLTLKGPTDFGLRAPDGGVRTITAMPATADVAQQVYALAEKPSRRLADHGAADIEYLNLAGEALLAPTQTCLQAITEAQGATGVVLDMRGYPGEEGFACLSRLTGVTLLSPRWRMPVLTGPWKSEVVDVPQWTVSPQTPAFLGPAVLLVGPTTVSAAETVSTILVDSGRLKKVLGRQSAGTNGDITYLLAPGALYFSFTGLEVLHYDGGTYHGRGIVPDVEVAPTVADYAAGEDRVLDAAIAALRGP